MSDEQLVASLKELTRDERRNLVAILLRVAELDARDVAAKAASPSLIEFCHREFGYAEGEAARRVHAARAAARYPVIFRLLDDGRLSLTAVCTLAPHLDRRNYRTLLRRAMGVPTRAVERLVAELKPEAPPRERVRYVGPPLVEDAAVEGDLFAAGPAGPALRAPAAGPDAAGPAGESALGAPPAAPPPEPRVEFKFSAPESLLREVDRARDLLRRRYPFCRLEDVFTEALGALLEDIDPERRIRRKESRGRTPEPPPETDGRRVPQAVKDAVWRRDGGACAFLAPDGTRCGSRATLEYDHLMPWALGGRSDDPDNVRLLCRAHNRLEARRVFGDATIDAALDAATDAGARA